MLKRIAFLLTVCLFSVAVPDIALAGPDNGACRFCEARYVAGVEHKHTSSSCGIPMVNCWDCQTGNCHWGTYVSGACDEHGHEVCQPLQSSLPAVQEALVVGDHAQIIQVASDAPQSVQVDHVSGYVLVLNCTGGVAAAYRLPQQMQRT